MLHELLRDSARAGGAAGRSPRRWPLVPVSIVLHLGAALAIVIVPLMAAVDPPEPAPLHRPRPWTVTMAHDADVPAATTTRIAAPDTVPTSAPSSIAPERAVEPAAAIPAPVALSDGLGQAALAGADAAIPVAPPPPPPTPARSVRREPVTPGGDIRPPRRIAGAPPVYPDLAMRARIEGVVILEALIDEEGRVDRVRVLRSQPLLDQAAMDAVTSWRYTPTLLNGSPVPVLMTVTVNFSLQR